MTEELELTKPIKLDGYNFWKVDIITVSQLRKKRIVDIKFTNIDKKDQEVILCQKKLFGYE